MLDLSSEIVVDGDDVDYDLDYVTVEVLDPVAAPETILLSYDEAEDTKVELVADHWGEGESTMVFAKLGSVRQGPRMPMLAGLWLSMPARGDLRGLAPSRTTALPAATGPSPKPQGRRRRSAAAWLVAVVAGLIVVATHSSVRVGVTPVDQSTVPAIASISPAPTVIPLIPKAPEPAAAAPTIVGIEAEPLPPAPAPRIHRHPRSVAKVPELERNVVKLPELDLTLPDRPGP